MHREYEAYEIDVNALAQHRDKLERPKEGKMEDKTQPQVSIQMLQPHATRRTEKKRYSQGGYPQCN